jgi:TM2 domain-containing membrane protein YozV
MKLKNKMNKIYPFLLLLFFGISLKGQKQIYGFKVVDNIIIIEYYINNQKFNLLFDTRSDITILDSAKAENARLIVQVKPHLLSLLTSNIIVYDIYNEFNEFPVLVASSKGFHKLPFDGVLGASKIMLENTIEIDFVKNRITIVDSIPQLEKNLSNYLKLMMLDSKNDSPKKNYMGVIPSITGKIFTNDSIIQTAFIINTGCRMETVILISDSLLIRKISDKKRSYSNIFSEKKIVDFCKINYQLDNNNKKYNSQSYIFQYNSGPFSTIGYKSIGVLLGVPFYKKFKSIIIDWPEKKLYLNNN